MKRFIGALLLCVFTFGCWAPDPIEEEKKVIIERNVQCMFGNCA